MRSGIIDDFDRVFALPNCRIDVEQDEVAAALWSTSPSVDLLVHPSAIRTAPRLSEATDANPIDAYVQDVLTVPASLAGLPALNVPAGVAADGWPVGLSLVGQWGSDQLLLDIAEVILTAEKDEERDLMSV